MRAWITQRREQMSNPYIGDRPLDPPEDDQCEMCDGFGFVPVFEDIDDEDFLVGDKPCSACQHEEDVEPDICLE